MPRTIVALVLLALAGVLPVASVALDATWYLDGPLLVMFAVVGGYAVGGWLPRRWAVVGVVALSAVLVGANQAHGTGYHWLDDAVFFLVVVGGPAAAGAAVTTRAAQVRRLTRLSAELDEVQRIEVAAARLSEQARVMAEVHSRIAEQVAAIAIRAEGAKVASDPTAFAAIETEGRAVLDRLRDTLGSLRADEPAQPAGQPPERTGALRLTALDIVVPAVIGAALTIETAVISDARGPLWANGLAALAVVAPLVVRRHHPIAATGLASAAGVAMSAALTPIPETVTGVALLVVIFYSVGAWCRGWWWLAGWGVATLGMVCMEWVAGQGDDAAAGDDAWIVLLWSVGAVAVGRITAGWQERVRRTKDVLDELERGRGAAVRLAVAQEREVLASELHDTVAHAMTAVCLQAGAHQHAGGDREAALAAIAIVAEKGLAELRDGLEAMDSADDPLDQARIVALGRRVGVDLRVRAEVTASGAAAALAHRVVREAVTNVARHAPGASAAVRIRGSGPDLWVEVVDGGSQRSPVLEGTGTGLRGLAETLESVGGTLAWEHLHPSGFRVAARIPQEQP